MSYSRVHCKKLYEEYKQLSKKIEIASHSTVDFDQDIILRKEELRRDLFSNCKQHLNLKNEEWLEIENG